MRNKAILAQAGRGPVELQEWVMLADRDGDVSKNDFAYRFLHPRSVRV